MLEVGAPIARPSFWMTVVIDCLDKEEYQQEENIIQNFVYNNIYPPSSYKHYTSKQYLPHQPQANTDGPLSRTLAQKPHTIQTYSSTQIYG